MYRRKGFTLIELLVVIAIIAIISVVVILTLNPAELLRQSRDSNRVSDLVTLTDAIGTFQTDHIGGFIGTSSVIYLSLPDPKATTTAGSDCSSLGFPAGGSYHCPASSTYLLTDGTGWLPVNLKSITGGSPVSKLPVDPTNSSSSGLYYEYTYNGLGYELAAFPESQKQKAQNSLFTNGSNKTLLYPTFFETGSVVSWTVPTGVTSITITAKGAGGGGNGSYTGAAGGLSVGTLAVTAGTTYYINVGGGGIGGVGGYDGGGSGGAAGGGGGGMTWFSGSNIFGTGSVILVAAGGGGGGGGGGPGTGGGTSGGNGGCSGSSGCGGGGGTQSAGGSGSAGGLGANSGAAGQGGNGSDGGGGSGYYGGGGGNTDGTSYDGDGGGGSSYLSASLTSTSTAQGGGAAGSIGSGSNGSLMIAY